MPSDILQVIEATGNRFNKVSSSKGGIYKGPCPWCGGNDRFSIYPYDGDGWYICNQCKRTGDEIQFYVDHDGMKFKDACIKAGRPDKAAEKPERKKPSDKNNADDVWEPRTIEQPVDVWVKKSESFLFSSYKFLLSAQGKKHREYLNSRGITDETIKKARLGYNPSPVQFSYDSFGLPIETDRAGKTKTVWIPDGVIIPYYNSTGLCRLRIRNANPQGKNRYVLLTGGTTEYFIYPGFDNSKWTVVIESELDGWLLWQTAGDIINVMALGNSTTRPDAMAFELLSSCPGILCALDHDDAGLIESAWWKKHLKAKWWPVPYGKDPGEAFTIFGVDFRVWVEAGINAPVQIIKKNEPVIGPEKEEAITTQITEEQQLKPILNSPERKITVSHISEKTKCRTGEPCIHISGGKCLLSGEYVHGIRVCTKQKWWICADDSCGVEIVVRGYVGGKAR